MKQLFVITPQSSRVYYKKLNCKVCTQIRLNMNGGASGCVVDFYGEIDMECLTKPCVFKDIFGNTIQIHPNFIAYARKVQVVEIEKTTLGWNGKYLSESKYSEDDAIVSIEFYVIGEDDECLVINAEVKNANRPKEIKDVVC